MARQVISDEEAQFFLDNGYLIIRNALDPQELAHVRSAMDDLTRLGSETVVQDPDFFYGTGHKTGQPVLRRIEYVIDKKDEMKVLLGNPFILNTVEKLIGPDLIPTWDSMVLKLPGEGVVIPWHRDAGTQCVGDTPIFNVDFYLDPADLDTCVWVIPGSHLWSEEKTAQWLQQHAKDHTRAEFEAIGAVPALMEPGDVLLHNILVIHGSPENSSNKLRRVAYYEFRSAQVEAEKGPHTLDYISLKQKVLLACIERRRRASYIPAEETPFVYNPPAPWNQVSLAPGEKLPTYRYPHEQFWRAA